MSRSLVASLKLMLTGNVSRQARKFGTDLDGMGRRGERSMARLERAAGRAGHTFGALLGRATAFGGAYFGAQGLRRVIGMEERLERLASDADMTSEAMAAMYERFQKTAELPKIRIDATELLSVGEVLQEKLGDVSIADDMREEIAMAIQATGEGGQVIGNLVATLYKQMNIRSREGMREALDILAVQGKAGQVELTNMAQVGPKVLAAFASVGDTGLDGVRKAGGLMQAFVGQSGDPTRAATVLENVTATLMDAAKLDKMRAVGVATRDEDGGTRDPVEILKELVVRAHAIPQDSPDALSPTAALSKIFDMEAMRGVGQLSNMYRDTGGFSELDSYIGVEADGSTIADKSERIARTASAQIDSSLSSLKSVAGDVLAPVVKELADALKGIDKQTMSDFAKGTAALAAALVAYKGVKGIAGIVGDLRGAVGPRRLPGPLGAVTDGPVRVFVTNPGFGKGLGLGKAAATGAATSGAATTATAATGGSALGLAARAMPGAAFLGLAGAAVKSAMDESPLRDPDIRARAAAAAQRASDARKADRTAIRRRFESETSPQPRPEAAVNPLKRPIALNPLRPVEPQANPAREAVIADAATDAPAMFRAIGIPGVNPVDDAAQAARDAATLRILEDIRSVTDEGVEQTRELRRDLKRASRVMPTAPTGDSYRIMGR